MVQSRRLNLSMAGDESAVALGLDVERFRRQMILRTAALWCSNRRGECSPRCTI